MINLKQWFRFEFDVLRRRRAGAAAGRLLSLLKRGVWPTMIRLLGIGLAAFLLTPSLLNAAAVTQGFRADKPLEVGTVVSVKADKGTDVEKTTVDNDERLIGVVVDTGNAVIDLQSSGSNVQVAVSGDVDILVSDLAGTVKKGDYLIASPLAGIAMKDNQEAEGLRYVAVANEDFKADTKGLAVVDVKQKNGSVKKTRVGLLSATLLLGERNAQNTEVNIITNIAQRIAGKPVSNTQIIAATTVFLTTFGLGGALLNGSVRGSFISLGRNPLSKHAILSSLSGIILLASGIITGGIALAFAVLRL